MSQMFYLFKGEKPRSFKLAVMITGTRFCQKMLQENNFLVVHLHSSKAHEWNLCHLSGGFSDIYIPICLL